MAEPVACVDVVANDARCFGEIERLQQLLFDVDPLEAQAETCSSAPPSSAYQLNRSIVRLRVGLGQRNIENGEEHTGEAQLSCNVHATQFHVHGYEFHGTHAALLNGLDEMIEVGKRSARTPETQPSHVGHISRFGRTRR